MSPGEVQQIPGPQVGERTFPDVNRKQSGEEIGFGAEHTHSPPA
jgi:hypothetical protein